jgi:uncharacterized protein YecE (DUF72 family)
MAGRVFIGTSGYQYRHWRGVLYPEKTPQREWMAIYQREFDTVEINNSFYRVPEATVFAKWRKDARENFCFALKFSRFGSHMKKLTDPEGTIGHFLERAERLGKKLGPILVQLPPRWKVNADRLDAFLAAAPGRHRWAVEFREESWLIPEVFDLLRRHNAALCVHDIIPDHPWQTTADWVYVRFHGINYGGSYSSQRLASEALRLRHCRDHGMDVYAYFNNDIGGHAVHNARQLRELM